MPKHAIVAISDAKSSIRSTNWCLR